MSNLEWQKHKLGDLFEVQRDSITPASTPDREFFHHSLPAWDECGGPVVAKGSEIESNKTLVTGPCVLVSKLNPRKPRVSVIEHVDPDTRHCASTEFVCLRPLTAQSLPFWGYYFSASEFAQKLDRHAIGSTNSHTRANPREPLKWLVSVPPVSEQKKIAQILDTLDTQIRQTEALIAKLERIKKGLLTDLLTRGIDQNGQLRPTPDQAPHLYKDSPLGRIPREWEVKLLRDCVCATTSITYGIVQAGPHVEDGIPYIRTGDMGGDALSLKGLLRTSPAIARQFERSRVREGEIVCAIRATVGKVLPVPTELDGANLTQGTARIAPALELDRTFLLWALRSQHTIKQVESVQKGTTFQEITLGQLQVLDIAVPYLRTEQEAIAGAMRKTDNKLSTEKRLLAELTKLKTGLMDDLLTGRVRVTPLLDPAEQASA